MPRTARIKSSTKIYHVMFRGNNRQTIFKCHEDYDKFIELLKEKVNNKELTVYAWCLMPNHAHLLVREKSDSLESVFISMITKYVLWYNQKYHRVGHLFQDRFKSRPVEDRIYFLRVFRYIHRNPLEAGLCKKMEDYPYSSYKSYFSSSRYKNDDIILDLMRKDDFLEYHHYKDTDDFITFNDSPDDDEVINQVLQTGLVKQIDEVGALSKEQRTQVIQMLLQAGVSYRKINAMTGVSMSIIRAISKDLHQSS